MYRYCNLSVHTLALGYDQQSRRLKTLALGWDFAGSPSIQDRVCICQGWRRIELLVVTLLLLLS